MALELAGDTGRCSRASLSGQIGGNR